MLKINSILSKSQLFFLVIIIVVVLWGGLSKVALSQQSESRFNALESDINSIESRLNRLESQINQSFRSGSSQVPVLPQPPNIQQNRLPSNREQMFDRLATLVIELKQQVNKLEERVSKLES